MQRLAPLLQLSVALLLLLGLLAFGRWLIDAPEAPARYLGYAAIAIACLTVLQLIITRPRNKWRRQWGRYERP